VIKLKTRDEVIKLKEGGAILARIMRKLKNAAKPGVSAAFLDKLAFKLINDSGGHPSFLNYKPEFATRVFPNSLCVSLNDVIVHGTPSKEIIFKRGDLISLDLGMEYKGLFTDHAITFGLEPITNQERKLILATYKALMAAVKAARPNRTLGDIGYAVQKEAERYGFKTIKDLTGHGVGYAVHEDPIVFNYGEQKQGLKLTPGLVLAIEPMVTFSNGAVKENSDGSFSTLDGKKACHFEHTIAILKDKTIILTK